MLDLEQRFPGKTIDIVGYSHGAALAVHYMLSTLQNDALPRVNRLVLLSPEIAVTKLAAFSVWQGRLGYLLGLDKLAWNSIHPEYDSFKYNSFAINAGDVSYRITAEIQKQLKELEKGNQLSSVPPVLAFTSVVDATVHAPALINNFLDRLQVGGHELVIYDVNRRLGIKQLYRPSSQEMMDVIRSSGARSFSLSLLTNSEADSREVLVRHWSDGLEASGEQMLNLAWPLDVFSLSHVALPFPGDDPLYGGKPEGFNPGLTLGNLSFRGERGTLSVSSDAMLRLRWNPFWDYQMQRIENFLSLDN